MKADQKNHLTAPDTGKECRIRLVGVMKGCAFGIRQPTLVSEYSVANAGSVDWNQIDQAIKLNKSDYLLQASSPETLFLSQFASRVSAIATNAMQQAGLAVFDRGRILGAQKTPSKRIVFSLATPYPSGASKPCFEVLVLATQFVWSLINSKDIAATTAAYRQRLNEQIKLLEKYRLQGTNSLRFLSAANAADIPWSKLIGTNCQYGWGNRQLWANSSILDGTPGMGISLARDKSACAHVLRQAGLPVPDHELAGSLEQARKIAERLGYPLVVKPANLDGGVGVAAGLTNEAQLDQAWTQAIKHSRSILVEKHQDGEDYRLIVFDGKMVWAVKRQAAGITGDGTRSIAALVSEANLDPRRGYDATATLRPLTLDEEAGSLLTEQNCSSETVLPAGQFVRLRRASNLSSGGTPEVVTDQVHPDNRQLVECAANLLRLDLAGIDLIIPDIGTSWKESGAGIIEVNAQPQLIAASQNHLYQTILKTRLPLGGRIPVVIIVGGAANTFADLLHQRMLKSHADLGLASAKGLWLGDRIAGRTGLSSFEAGRALLLQRETAALLLVIDDESVLNTGLPVDRYDALIVVKTDPPVGDEQPDWLSRALPMLLPHCAGNVLLASNAAMSAFQKMGLASSPRIRLETNMDNLASHIDHCIRHGLATEANPSAGTKISQGSNS